MLLVTWGCRSDDLAETIGEKAALEQQVRRRDNSTGEALTAPGCCKAIRILAIQRKASGARGTSRNAVPTLMSQKFI